MDRAGLRLSRHGINKAGTEHSCLAETKSLIETNFLAVLLNFELSCLAFPKITPHMPDSSSHSSLKFSGLFACPHHSKHGREEGGGNFLLHLGSAGGEGGTCSEEAPAHQASFLCS